MIDDGIKLEDYEKCMFCKKAGTISLERDDELNKDLERDLLLVCDNCFGKFMKIRKTLRLVEEKNKKKGGKK